MIAKIGKMMTKREDKSFSYEELAAMLKTSPGALKTFEDAYKKQVLDSGALSENLLQWDTATVKAMLNVIYTSAEGKCRKETGTSFAELPLIQRFDAVTRYIEDEFETCLMMLSDIPYMQWT